MPRYANAQTISFTDERIKGTYVTYHSPGGNSGKMRGYLVQPKGNGPFPSVLVVHENRGLNPYIEDVARRCAVEGFLALAPDGLFPVGGYPGNDDDGRDAAGQARPEQAAHRHAEQRQVPQGARALVRQARRHRLLLGRRHDQLSRRHAGRRPQGRGAVLWRGAGGDRGARHQGAAADPLRRERRAHQFDVAGLREGAEGRQRAPTSSTPIPARSTASTTTPRRATRKPPPSSPGSAPSACSRRPSRKAIV